MTQQDATRSAGRGGLAVTGAKIYFIVLGLVQQIALPLVLGLGGTRGDQGPEDERADENLTTKTEHDLSPR